MFRKYTLIFVFYLFLPFSLVANEIAILPNNPNLSTGTLPNGTHYYIFKSQNLRGMADFALVQKFGYKMEDAKHQGFVTKKAQMNLRSLPLFFPKVPQTFFISHGASLGNEGFLEFRDDATILRVKNLMIAKDEAIIDSTFLAFFSTIRAFSSERTKFERDWCAPDRHAIVVSGDIDPEKIKEKLNVISLMVRAKKAKMELPEYSWTPAEQASYTIKSAEDKTFSKISLSYSMARMPKAYMNSVQPVIMEKFLGELCIVLENRITEILSSKFIPHTGLTCSYLSSLDSFKDESFDVSIEVLDTDVEATLSALALALGSIDRQGIDILEYAYAKKTYICEQKKRDEAKDRDNTASLERCIAAFLYNAPLSSLEQEHRFISNRIIDDAVELELLEKISSALLDDKLNLSLQVSTNRADICADDLRENFENAWKQDYVYDFNSWYGKDLEVEVPILEKRSKIKLRSIRKDAISGGELWTYSNGIKVIYRKMKTDGKLHFSLGAMGGYASLADLAPGEGAYLTDIFNVYSIGSLPGEAYRRALATKGMELYANVGVYDTRIFGSAPMDSLSLALSVLRDIAINRKIDEAARDKYIAKVPLELASMVGTGKERLVKVEELMCPGYLYSSYMSQNVATLSLFDRAHDLFNQIFNNLDDSYLVLLGDEDEEIVKKKLLPIVAKLPVASDILRRPLVRALPIVGKTTIVEESTNSNTDLVISNSLLLTTENYIAAQVSTVLLQERLGHRLNADAFHVNSTMRFTQSPEERLTIYLSLIPLKPEAFVNPRTNISSLDLMTDMRAALNDDITIDYINTILPVYKSVLKGQFEKDIQSPSIIAEAVLLRYLDGKDLITRYIAAIDALTPEHVMNVINTLREGATIEYIVEKNGI